MSDRINLQDELVEATIPTRTYKLENGRISGWVNDLKAMVQAVDKILKTVRFDWVIYSDNYGHELDKLIGQDYSYVKSELERVVSEALLADDRITAIENFKITSHKRDSLKVSFLMGTIFGQTKVRKEITL